MIARRALLAALVGGTASVVSTEPPSEPSQTPTPEPTPGVSASVDTDSDEWRRKARRFGGYDIREFGARGNGDTIDAALTAALPLARSARCGLYFPAGRYRHTVPIDVDMTGDGRGATYLDYDGTGAAATVRTPGASSYHRSITGLTLRTETGATGIDLDTVCQAHVTNVEVRGFVRGVHIRSTTNGGALYNVFNDVTASLCQVGFHVDAVGSNENKFEACRTNFCWDGWRIDDGNHNVLTGCATESGNRGVVIAASTMAKSDGNVVAFHRFEELTGAMWVTGSTNVRHTRIVVPYRVTASTGDPIDRGTSTQVLGD